jgi:hypothetical protein
MLFNSAIIRAEKAAKEREEFHSTFPFFVNITIYLSNELYLSSIHKKS